MKKITVSAPGKLMLFGEHSVVYGHPCIVTAADQRIYVTLQPNGSEIFSLEAPDLGLKAYSKTIDDLGKRPLPKSVRFIETLYKIFLEKYPQKKTIHVTTKSEFSSTYGFGSSSAATVAFAKALLDYYQINLSKKELFDLCYQAVIEVQGVGSGYDIAAAIWGGTLKYISPAKVVNPLNIKKLPLIVGYTGVKADTPTIVRYVKEKMSQYPEKINHIYDNITSVVEEAETALVNLNYATFGELMSHNQELLRKLEVSSVELENLIVASLENQALGAKLSGAGGGDCMLALYHNEDQKKTIRQGITQAGGEVLPVNLNAPGVRLEN